MTFLDAIPSLLCLTGITYAMARVGIFGANSYDKNHYLKSKSNYIPSDGNIFK